MLGEADTRLVMRAVVAVAHRQVAQRQQHPPQEMAERVTHLTFLVHR